MEHGYVQRVIAISATPVSQFFFKKIYLWLRVVDGIMDRSPVIFIFEMQHQI